EPNEPFLAALFVAENQQVPAEPSIREFRFDEENFKLLPEMEPETPFAAQRERRRGLQRQRNYVAVGVAAVLCVVALLFYWSAGQTGAPSTFSFLGSSQ